MQTANEFTKKKKAEICGRDEVVVAERACIASYPGFYAYSLLGYRML
jgi:hypothetical protein